jgi:hypothetical protein
VANVSNWHNSLGRSGEGISQSTHYGGFFYRKQEDIESAAHQRNFNDCRAADGRTSKNEGHWIRSFRSRSRPLVHPVLRCATAARKYAAVAMFQVALVPDPASGPEAMGRPSRQTESND